MKLADVNILIYAFRSDLPQHELCKPWLDRLILSDAAFAVSLQVLSAVVRMTTGPSFMKTPSSLDEAFGFCHDILDQQNCRIVEPGDRHWAIFERLCRDTHTTGPRVTDAWFAALAIEHGCEWITFDRDYARFPGLKWSLPA